MPFGEYGKTLMTTSPNKAFPPHKTCAIVDAISSARFAGALVLACTTPCLLKAQVGSVSGWRIVASASLTLGSRLSDIDDLAVSPAGDVVLLDAARGALLRLERTKRSLRFAGTLHLPGAVAPVGIAFDKGGHLYVLDNVMGRISRFTLYRDSVRLENQIPVPEGATRFCFLGDSLVVLTGAQDHLFEVLHPNDRVGRWLGIPFGDDLPEAVALSASFGPLLCVSTSSSIIQASTLLGEVRRYSASGTLVWRQRIRGYRGVVISSRGEYAASFDPRPDGTHSLISLQVAPSLGIIVQLGLSRGSQASRWQPISIETRFLDGATGLPLGDTAFDIPALLNRRGEEYYGVALRGKTIDIIVLVPPVSRPR